MTPIDPILHELADEHREQGAPPAVERALMTEFRRRQRRSWWPWLGTSVAAVASAVFAFYWIQAPPADTLALHVAGPSAPEVRLTPKPAASVPMRARAATRQAKAAPAPAVPARAAAEITTDFFPLRAGRVLEPGEMAQVVRTRIPRRELVRFGLVSTGFQMARPAAGDIQADVVFGYDGTARAIRFVHDSQ